jgi:hypothetical protein
MSAMTGEKVVATALAEFSPEMFKDAMVMAQGLSDYEMEPYVREKMKDCLASNPTPSQVYDCCAEIAALPCQRCNVGGVTFAVGHISGFMQALFDVTKYYQRPAS